MNSEPWIKSLKKLFKMVKCWPVSVSTISISICAEIYGEVKIFQCIDFVFSSGACNESPNSRITGSRKSPNSARFIRHFNRRPGCKGIAVNEHRTTMLCNHCRTPNIAPTNNKHRYRTCRNCRPRNDLELPFPSQIVTMISKRKLDVLRDEERIRLGIPTKQQLRQQRLNGGIIDVQPAVQQQPQPYGPHRPLDIPRTHGIVSKIAHIVKTDRCSLFTTKVWNRDINAGRNILLKGMKIFGNVNKVSNSTTHTMIDIFLFLLKDCAWS